MQETFSENCFVCGKPLEYLAQGKVLSCSVCGKEEIGNVCCVQGHYVCEDCHGKGTFKTILNLVLKAQSSNPLEIAEEIINAAPLPMLGCEHAWIAAGALLAAIRNHGKINVTDEQISEALNRTRRQAIGAYCGLTGVCGVAVAIGACFSVMLGAACPKDQETAVTMHIVSKIIKAIADQTGPCCCKNFVRTALAVSCSLAREHLKIDLPCTLQITCRDSQRHPHGCRGTKCSYFPIEQKR